MAQVNKGVHATVLTFARKAEKKKNTFPSIRSRVEREREWKYDYEFNKN